MITLKITDKNGRELCDGDTIRYAKLHYHYEDLNGLQGYYIDAEFRWETLKIDVQKMYDKEGLLYIPSGYYDKDDILTYFSIFKEEMQVVFDSVKETLGVTVNSEDELEDLINGFEII